MGAWDTPGEVVGWDVKVGRLVGAGLGTTVGAMVGMVRLDDMFTEVTNPPPVTTRAKRWAPTGR